MKLWVKTYLLLIQFPPAPILCSRQCLHTTQNSQNKWTKISDLETNIFEPKVGVKSGLAFFILKFYQPLQRYLLTCQANSAFLGNFFCTGQQQLRRGQQNFKIKKIQTNFHHHFLSQKFCFQDLRFYFIYSRISGGVCEEIWKIDLSTVCHTINLQLSFSGNPSMAPPVPAPLTLNHQLQFNLADQLTLFQSGVGRLCPPLPLAPQKFFTFRQH